MSDHVPSGSSREAVAEYFRYLYAQHVGEPVQQVGINWTLLAWWAFWVLVLVVVLYAFTTWQQRTRASQELYPVETYDGYISDGNGPVGRFLLLFFAIVAGWLIYTTVRSLTYGQIY
jgi:hypothetical protein